MNIKDEIILYCDSRIDRLSICLNLKETPQIKKDLQRIRHEVEILNKIKEIIGETK